MIGETLLEKNAKNFLKIMQKLRLKLLYHYRENVYKPQKFNRLLIGRKFYYVNDQLSSKSYLRFEMSNWVCGC